MVAIVLHYGQYKVCDILKYRTHKLCGLRQELKALGHDVQLVPSQHWDRLEVEVAGRNIFTCRLSFLEYNCRYKDDQLAKKIVEAINETFLVLDLPEPEPPQKEKKAVASISEETKQFAPTLPQQPEPYFAPRYDEQYETYEQTKPLDTLSTPKLFIPPLEPKICDTCAECYPYCTCPEILEEELYESCDVCGPYCVCEKLPSKEFINLCTKCGETCICSSESEGSLNICNIIVKPRNEEGEKMKPTLQSLKHVDYSQPFPKPCDVCEVCTCDTPVCL